MILLWASIYYYSKLLNTKACGDKKSIFKHWFIRISQALESGLLPSMYETLSPLAMKKKPQNLLAEQLNDESFWGERFGKWTKKLQRSEGRSIVI